TAYGQTSCPSPVIVQIAGTNPSCGAQPVTLDAGSGWTSYQWSTGATTRTISDTPPATTTYSVTTIDANGCSASSVPYQVTAAPVIHLNADAVCPGAYGSAYIDSPEPVNGPNGWSTVHWTIDHGTINYESGSAVSFTTDPAGRVATLTVTATDNYGCTNSATATVPVRSVPPPAL